MSNRYMIFCLMVFAGLANVCAGSAGDPSQTESKPEWANREVFELNREPAHAFTHRFPSKETARTEPDWASPYHPDRYKSLNGTWKFNWSENPKSAPVDFQKPDYDTKNWDDITVPLAWQLAGYGELYYFNVDMPMISHPRNAQGAGQTGENKLVNLHPRFLATKLAKEGWVPTEFNPVGSYVTDFTVPENWMAAFSARRWWLLCGRDNPGIDMVSVIVTAPKPALTFGPLPEGVPVSGQ